MEKKGGNTVNFASPEYLLFLPLIVLLHWISPKKQRWIVLLAASLYFYASWNLRMTFLLLSVIAVSYLGGLLMNGSNRSAKTRQWILILCLLCLIGILAVFKYAGFLARTLEDLLHIFQPGTHISVRDILLPVGLSFYTFQAASYLIDVYRGTIPVEKHPGYYALYISFFPQLVAGPIERASDMLPQLKQERTLTQTSLRSGFLLLLSGFFRKIVIADSCASFVDAVYAMDSPDGSVVFLATLLFGFQIYCDFSGYSEIAAGSASLFGIRLTRNFNRPYASRSIQEFWRRWHVTLGRWFQDYVYIPLGGNRKGPVRHMIALWTVFLLSGLWHGADWSFVLWGALHALYMTGGLLFSRLSRKRLPVFLQISVTFLLVSFSWIFFRASSVEHAFLLLHRLFLPWQPAAALSTLSLDGLDVVWLAGALAQLPLLNHLADGGRVRVPVAVYVYLFICIVIVCWMRLDSNVSNAFLYFQF